MTSGGKRKGAGRKFAPPGTTKVPRAIKIDRQIDAYLRQCENATAAIEGAVRRSKDFREWAKARQP